MLSFTSFRKSQEWFKPRWGKFSNINFLRIKSDYEQCCPILPFLDQICLKCPNLEEFYYEGSSRPYECINIEGLKTSDFEDHEKFLNLKKLHIEFDGENSVLFDSESDEPIDEMFEFYKTYYSRQPY